MFSIIIPLYNKAPYVRKCLESVFAQTYTDFELIVVDDGSTDDSFAQLSVISYQLSVQEPDRFKKIKIVQQENQGVSMTRNNGVKLAKYPYIAFLDTDDWWEPTYLEEMKGLIEKYPEGGLYSSSYYKVVQGRNIPANIGVEAGFTDGVIDYFEVYAKTMYQPVWTGAAMMRKQIFEQYGGFHPSLKMGEDFDLWYRVALQQPVVLLNRPLAYYNQDVEQANRAIGTKLYEPEQHFLFSDYTKVHYHKGFQKLYEVLAVYGLLPYYLAGKNKSEVKQIIKQIHWKKHPAKYFLYYRVLPRWMVRCWFSGLKMGVELKRKVVGSD